MPNYHTAWVDGITNLTAASMNPALASLDHAVTYGAKRPIVHTDGDITWSGGTLTWAGTIRILFNTAAGLAVQNTIAAGNISLSDNEFCYVTLSETNNAVLTMSKAVITTAAASNFLALGILVMGYRNATNDEFFPVALQRAMSEYLPGGEQVIACADNVTVDWSKGATAIMTFDRNAVAFTFSNPVAGRVYRLMLTQGDGSDLATWTTTIKWAGGAAPVLSTAAGAIDIITFVYINSVWYGSATLNFATPA